VAALTYSDEGKNRPMPDTSRTQSESRKFTPFSEITSFIWSVADLLRGDYKQADYGKVILPITGYPPR
jgi:type I restriction-modification system DNA methylase subunit